MRLLRKALVEGYFLLDLDAKDMASILGQTLDYVVARGLLPPEMRGDVAEGLLKREQQVSTAIGNAVAVPHTYLDAFTEPIIVFVRLSHAINLGAPDGVPTRFQQRFRSVQASPPRRRKALRRPWQRRCPLPPDSPPRRPKWMRCI